MENHHLHLMEENRQSLLYREEDDDPPQDENHRTKRSLAEGGETSTSPTRR
jgi:hypothetical protein